LAPHGRWMAALFALGVMSITWMVLIAALIVIEKVPALARDGRGCVTVVVLLVPRNRGSLSFPIRLPGLTVPDSTSAMHAMDSMSMHWMMST